MPFLRDCYLRFRRARRLRRWPRPRAFRYERFGGIAQLGGSLGMPQALVFVDHDRARALGHDAPPADLWPPAADGSDGKITDSEIAAILAAPLSAPLEAHLQLTNRCAAGCQGCYTGATAEGAPGEWGLPEWCRALDELAAAGVFHVALGGGESALLPWLGELLAHARSRGIVPNLTTSGLYEDAVLTRLCGWAHDGLFGQINVSIDGVDDDYTQVRGFAGFAQADRALVALRRHSPDVGINCVLTRGTFPTVSRLFAYARRRAANEIELLRFKPAGRGARREVYAESRMSDEQHRELLPTVLALSRRHRLRVRLDCSFTPMVAYHQPPQQLMQFLCIYGCAAGDLLVAARSSGALSACSFFPSTVARIDALRDYRDAPDSFPSFRRYLAAPPEPCRSCEYQTLCRGGCRAVAVHINHDPQTPDPECPRVLAYHAATSENGTTPGASPEPLSPAAKKRLPVLA
jgi:radical SAM protein with 4Fe4S-binding SPASM domain